ncbi:uncharacterized protein LACBIDRAFT_308611 [Laccaria bicolor S238N-H82]|uniref:Predicted protein n=1 Tax=Laccaria bicolor (strain S238N-H82 / ATCC MYA-4686) TaxID=486041 RepID=B0CWS2_LACBS|nr:uncharacterized protein LACBIDRAFT_308611 [Laccaria bicolor S238N-H82]EDR13122.1 predicted protein [Laccaria bicolor S238N-H82]|eukprot:XP_001875620.1 predicted protein [Laccaria bicolor S238N-H82]
MIFHHRRPRIVNPPLISRTHPQPVGYPILHYLRENSTYCPPLLCQPLHSWWDCILLVLSPKWLRTSVLMWSTWCAMALGTFLSCVEQGKKEAEVVSSIHNVQRLPPKTPRNGVGLDPQQNHHPSHQQKHLNRVYGMLLFSLLWVSRFLRVWLIEMRLGQRWSLAQSTFITVFFCMVFVLMEST